MKSQKHLKSRINFQNCHIQTNKHIGLQLRKQEFFKDVIQRIQAEFHPKDLEFLMQNIEITFNRDKKTKYCNETSNHNQRMSNVSINALEEQPLPRDIMSECKKENFNPFQTCYKQFLMKNKPNIQKEVKQYSCTPIRVSIDIKKRFPKRLFQVDQKMRKNYERIKQRIIFNSPEDTFRATNSIRNSQLPQRHSNTQRACRYKTQCPDSQNQVQEFVPRMLLGDLVKRHSFQDEKLNMIGCNQKRFLCFKKNQNGSVGSGIRRRFRLHP